MMYKCKWCGAVDDEPNVIEEKETGWRGLTCRRCGSDMVEADRCVECDECFSEECGDDFFHTAQGEGYCATCLKALCNTKTGLEYLRHFNLEHEFVDFLVDFNDFPFVKRVLLHFLQNVKEENEPLNEKIWEYVEEDYDHFAKYIYSRKGSER